MSVPKHLLYCDFACLFSPNETQNNRNQSRFEQVYAHYNQIMEVGTRYIEHYSRHLCVKHTLSIQKNTQVSQITALL